MSVSVALAAKDGARYLRSQVDSILPQLSETRGDELVISVDPSTDETENIVGELAQQHSLVKAISGPSKGVQANFECALKECGNSHIFLSDQDDIWMLNKIERVLESFENSSAVLVVHDAEVVDEHLKPLQSSYFALRKSGPGTLKNIYKNTYMGCCMAFRAELLDAALPFPSNIPMHDQWLGLIAEKKSKVHFLPEQLVQYRRHDRTATSDTHASGVQMFTWRRNLISALEKRSKELK